MNLRSLDLNLLVILDALLDEAHVSRAADRLGLSQPATSAALQRCRHLFYDELLERGRGTMRLTARAESLRAALKSLLAGVGDLIDPPEVPLAEIRQTLRIAMADYPALFVTGPLQCALAGTAPGLDLVIQPWLGGEAARAALVDGTTDIAISVLPGEDADIHREELLSEHYIIAMRPGHPAIAGFDFDGWLAYPHILVSGRGDARSPLDAELARLGRSRRIGLVVPSFGMVPDLLRGSDMIAMLPSRVMPAAPDLIARPVPIPVSGFPLHLAWHRRRAKDRALRHVADLLAEILR
ncbi:LysR family transcriptional regulator [Paracoccus aminophilus]|uniref:Transcriptional regulator, LysR family n=1 Tax=Paracoccus aminophilus JCM 7686 TaxID=1367847 RepID=S5Z0L4_PARAH|nr:LysR substrate-binding domain-containing protein [Paracoccus aminophilus]AGT10996.1 transcriptional regulator, LysR family [Paracoccus aminophilus JCM 7686]